MTRSGNQKFSSLFILPLLILACSAQPGCSPNDGNSGNFSHNRDSKKVSLHDNMILIEACPYLMGGDTKESKPDEQPVHEVHLESFYIDKYEVTNRQYQVFIRAFGTHYE